MDPRLLQAFLTQLQFQCNVIVVASQEVQKGVEASDAMHVFVHLQSLLNGAASVSKVCWGSGGKRAAARAPIRSAIGISDASPFRDVSARNHFEHFDERIEDDWWPKSTAHQSADLSVGPIGIISRIAPQDRFRYFDQATGDLYYFGEHFNVSEIVAEARRLQPAIDAAIMSTWGV
jgi:hypothetical protein